MILSANPVAPRISPIARESSRAESTIASGESSKAAIAQDATNSENADSRAPSPTDRVNEPADVENIQATSNSKQASDNVELSEPDRKVLEQLKSRDREVRAHEAAHLAAAGSHATSGASYSYQRGPDGQLYAIGGEVGVSVGKVSGDPEATLAKAEQIRGAALAPSQPSAQDRAIAVRAGQLAAEARQEIAQAEFESEGDVSADKNVASVDESVVRENSKADTSEAQTISQQTYEDVSDIKDEQTTRLLDVHI